MFHPYENSMEWVHYSHFIMWKWCSNKSEHLAQDPRLITSRDKIKTPLA